MTALEVERIGEKVVAQLVMDNGRLVFKSPAADKMGRDNSELVTDDLMGLQLPAIRAPIAMVTEADGQVLEGAETAVEAQVNEEYEGEAEYEDEASVVDDGEQFDESEDEVDVDMSDSRLKASALLGRTSSVGTTSSQIQLCCDGP